MPSCRRNILYKPVNTNLSCHARTHCNTCTFLDDNQDGVPNNGDQPNGNQQENFETPDNDPTLGITNPHCLDNGKPDIQLFNNNDRFIHDNNFIITLDCCDTTCNSKKCCFQDPIRPKKNCNNPCIDGALPLLTKCEVKKKKQLQHKMTLVNPCTEVFPNPCPNTRNPIRPVKSYNKKYSFNEQLLLLKSKSFNKSVYNCNQFVKNVGCRNRNGGAVGATCPTSSCFN